MAGAPISEKVARGLAMNLESLVKVAAAWGDWNLVEFRKTFISSEYPPSGGSRGELEDQSHDRDEKVFPSKCISSRILSDAGEEIFIFYYFFSLSVFTNNINLFLREGNMI